NPKGMDGKIGETLTEKIFNTKVEIIKELQDLKYSEEDFINYRKELLDDVLSYVSSLNEESFRVRMKIKFVHKYKNEKEWDALGAIALNEIKENISSLITPINDDEMAKRFDNLMYTIKLAYLQNKNAGKPIRVVIQTAETLSKLGTIPQIMEQKYIIDKVRTEEFWESADIFDYEEVRASLRDLIKYIEREGTKIYYTNFKDEITEVKENDAMYGVNDLKNYKKKVEHYLKEHKDEMAIYKLRNNKILTKQDLDTLEGIMWEKLGSKEDYVKEFGDTPVNKLVRKIVGLDRGACNEAFSNFLSEEKLNVNQIRFVKLIVDYIVANGMIDDNSVLQQEPFRSIGSIVSLFKDNMDDARGIMGVINEIKINSEKII
ncbi:MAG: type I restriction-modification enzyme R subunit C-terminal domain-containing protein, partial [Peptostreptococcaceae bacterium]